MGREGVPGWPGEAVPLQGKVFKQIKAWFYSPALCALSLGGVLLQDLLRVERAHNIYLLFVLVLFMKGLAVGLH